MTNQENGIEFIVSQWQFEFAEGLIKDARPSVPSFDGLIEKNPRRAYQLLDGALRLVINGGTDPNEMLTDSRIRGLDNNYVGHDSDVLPSLSYYDDDRVSIRVTRNPSPVETLLGRHVEPTDENVVRKISFTVPGIAA